MADDITTLRRILASARTIAVVGLSAEWHRPSHFAAQYMQAKGYRVIPVNPRYESILGERCMARLEDITEPVDIVDVFRRTEDVLPIAESAVRKSQEYIFLDRLQYLVAGGRLSKTKGFLGDLFDMKPVISPAAEGAVKAGTVRDNNAQLTFAMEKLEKGLGQDTRPLIMIEYTDNRQWVENNVLGEIKCRYASAEIILQPLSLTSGAHMGPGTWGVAFLPSPL